MPRRHTFLTLIHFSMRQSRITFSIKTQFQQLNHESTTALFACFQSFAGRSK